MADKAQNNFYKKTVNGKKGNVFTRLDELEKDKRKRGTTNITAIVNEVVGSTPALVNGVPAGADTNVQYNDGGAFGGDANLTWNKTAKVLTLNQDSFGPNIQGVANGGSTGVNINGGNATIADYGGGVALLQAGDGLGDGSGGNAYLISGNGGDGTGQGGFVTITSGEGNNGGGDIEISTGGALSDGDGGDIILSPGVGAGAGIDGQVIINGVVNITIGASGTFTTVDLKTVTVANGIITSIV